MTYAIVTADRHFTEAHYDSWVELVKHWEIEIKAGTHRLWVFA